MAWCDGGAERQPQCLETREFLDAGQGVPQMLTRWPEYPLRKIS
jgi:hypothetical protein